MMIMACNKEKNISEGQKLVPECWKQASWPIFVSFDDKNNKTKKWPLGVFGGGFNNFITTIWTQGKILCLMIRGQKLHFQAQLCHII